MNITTRKLSDKHEADLVDILGGKASRGSGNQWNNPADGRHDRTLRFNFAWDGKATLAASASVKLTDWQKIREQSGEQRPLLPIRFYANEKLDVVSDLVVMDLHDFAEVLRRANGCGCW